MVLCHLGSAQQSGTRHRIEGVKATREVLCANRLGRLGKNQSRILRRDYRFLMAGSIIAIPFVLLFAYVGFRPFERPVTMAVGLVAAVAITVVVYWLGHVRLSM